MFPGLKLEWSRFCRILLQLRAFFPNRVSSRTSQPSAASSGALISSSFPEGSQPSEVWDKTGSGPAWDVHASPLLASPGCRLWGHVLCASSAFLSEAPVLSEASQPRGQPVTPYCWAVWRKVRGHLRKSLLLPRDQFCVSRVEALLGHGQKNKTNWNRNIYPGQWCLPAFIVA